MVCGRVKLGRRRLMERMRLWFSICFLLLLIGRQNIVCALTKQQTVGRAYSRLKNFRAIKPSSSSENVLFLDASSTAAEHGETYRSSPVKLLRPERVGSRNSAHAVNGSTLPKRGTLVSSYIKKSLTKGNLESKPMSVSPTWDVSHVPHRIGKTRTTLLKPIQVQKRVILGSASASNKKAFNDTHVVKQSADVKLRNEKRVQSVTFVHGKKTLPTQWDGSNLSVRANNRQAIVVSAGNKRVISAKSIEENAPLKKISSSTVKNVKKLSKANVSDRQNVSKKNVSDIRQSLNRFARMSNAKSTPPVQVRKGDVKASQGMGSSKAAEKQNTASIVAVQKATAQTISSNAVAAKTFVATVPKAVCQNPTAKTPLQVNQNVSGVGWSKASAVSGVTNIALLTAPSALALKVSPALSVTASVRLSDTAKQCRLKYSVNGQKIVLFDARHRFEFRNGTKEAMVDGIKIFLSFPVEIEPMSTTKLKGFVRRLHLIAPEYRIRTADIETIIKPLLFPQNFLKKRAKVIVIDPGHGGKAEGTVQNGLKEKLLTLKTGQLLASKLRAMGYIVHLTRTADVDVPLKQRSAFANAKGADLFVSVHYNSAQAKQARGVEVFTFPLAGYPSSDQIVTHECDRVAINAFDGQNSLLGWLVQKQIIQKTGSVDRGVKRKRLAVLRNLNCPGILIECGFLSNFDEAKACNSAIYQEKLTQAIADGIRAYNGS